MAGGGELNLARPFICAFCDAGWPSARSLVNHCMVHAGENARTVPRGAGPPAAKRARGVSVTPTILVVAPPEPDMSTWLSLAPPPAPCACVICRMAMVVPAPPPVQRPGSPPPPVPVAGAGNTIRMIPLDPNPAFSWERYRSGLEHERDFLEPRRKRPQSPSPSFRDWI